MRISDWSSDVCSSDLEAGGASIDCGVSFPNREQETMRKRSMFHRSIFRADPNGDPDINTTPLIDVMLVMLVMFIITIPPPTHSVDVTLPVGAIEPGKILDQNRVTIDTSDVIRWNDEAIDLAELGVLVKQASERAKPAAILLKPDAREIGRASCRERVCQYV